MSTDPKPAELTEAEIRSLEEPLANWAVSQVWLDDTDPLCIEVARIVAAREAAARREALLEAADRWVDERTDLLKSREAWRERAEAAESARTGDGWPEALREQGRVLRALGVAIEWEQIAREQRPHLGCLDMYNHCAGELRAALAEPERDEEGGR